MSRGRLRLFFAVWPSPAAAAAAHEVARTLCTRAPARLVGPDSLHLTLRFLGSRDEEELRPIVAAAATLRGRPFQLQLNRSGFWKRAKAAWLAPDQAPAALLELEAGLGRALENIGIAPEQRAFSPHVTIARGVRGLSAGPLEPPLRWDIDHFRLMRSVTYASGPEYTELARWPLTA